MKIDRVTLALAKKYTDEHGGGGGTSNYNSLSNKPKINDVELSGNKTLGQLGVPLDTSDLTNGAGFITENDIPAIPEKTSDLTNDSGFITNSDLPTKVSDLTNDAGYITKSVDDLTNYTTTSGMNTALSGKVSTSTVGTAGGVAELDNTGKVPSAQLPSYVDDVVDGYYNETDHKFYEESTYTTEIPGEAGKIYISVDTDLQYRWTGSAFAAMGGALVLGETSSTAYRGDRGKEAYDISQTVGNVANLTTTEKNTIVGAVNEVNAKTAGHTVKDEGTAKTARAGLNFVDHDITDDSTNDNTVIQPHELTSAEMQEIISPLPGKTDNGIILDERGGEYVVGKYIYSDGTSRPIYQKTINLSWSTMTQDQTTNKHIVHNIPISAPVEVVALLYKSNNTWIAGSPTGAINDYAVGCHFDITNLYITCGNTMTSRLSSIVVTIRYTKTTDTPV